jgi:hypothetical protein
MKLKSGYTLYWNWVKSNTGTRGDIYDPRLSRVKMRRLSNNTNKDDVANDELIENEIGEVFVELSEEDKSLRRTSKTQFPCKNHIQALQVSINNRDTK